EVSAQRLLALDGLKQGLEVPLAEAAASPSLDDLEKERRAVSDRPCEDLQHVAFVVPIDENAQLGKRFDGLAYLADSRFQFAIVGLRHPQELDTLPAQRANRLEYVIGRKRNVLNSRPSVKLEILLDLRFVPS